MKLFAFTLRCFHLTVQSWSGENKSESVDGDIFSQIETRLAKLDKMTDDYKSEEIEKYDKTRLNAWDVVVSSFNQSGIICTMYVNPISEEIFQ